MRGVMLGLLVSAAVLGAAGSVHGQTPAPPPAGAPAAMPTRAFLGGAPAGATAAPYQPQSSAVSNSITGNFFDQNNTPFASDDGPLP
jgi:hypothetical protein